MSYLLATYKRFPVAFTHGEGAYLWDKAGKRYLDFLAGIAVCGLGHAHPRLVAALSEQARKLWHVSNYFEIPEQEALAEALVARSGMAAAFFCNSGAEANEALVKLVRLWGKAHRGGAHEVITLTGSFHGRTMAMLSATGQDKVKVGFDPFVPAFKHVPANNVEALETVVSSRTAAVLVEVIQGEGGIRVLSPEYLKAVKAVCDRENLLLLVDEVQTGMGRTGSWFGFQSVEEWAGFTPDAISLAKGLAGGFPIGAALIGEKARALFSPGSHASTFGGNPLACRVALELVWTIEEENILERVLETGKVFYAGLRDLQKKYGFVKDVRGRGLMLGAELDPAVDAAAIVARGLKRGLILNAVQGSVLRFVPPLVITAAQISDGLDILDELFKEV